MLKMLNNSRIKFLLYFSVLVTIGSSGYYLIGGSEWTIIDSIYMTVITLSTVGFGEVHVTSEIGKLWTIIVIIFGVSGFAALASQIGMELIEFKNYRSRKMRKKIGLLENHYLICGYGRMGAVIASELHQKNIPFVVIEIDSDKIQILHDLKYMYYQGDATLDDTLIAVSVESANGIVVVLDNDQDNLFVTMSARNLNSKAYLISRCAKNDTGKKLKRAGADKVVNPYITGGHKMSELLLSPFVEDSVTIESPDMTNIDLVLEEIKISHIGRLHNQPIKNSLLREDYELLIVGIIEADGKITLNPGSGVILKYDQKIMVIGSADNLNRFKSELDN